MKEKINFKEELPISITVGNYYEHPIHFHDELEIVYLLKGSINMRNGHYSYQLKEGDIYFFNEREMHSFEAVDDEENLMLILHVDLKYYQKYYEGKLENNWFVSGIDDGNGEDESIETLKSIIAKIMMEKIQKGYGYEHRIIEKGHNLIGILLAEFQYYLLEDGKFINCKKKKENKVLTGRLTRITTYMYENYHRKLTLNEIAEREHLSLFYLSHVIKEATGLSYQDLLNFIRVEESEKLLLGTNKKMGAIAEECGFSALRYFVKHFEQWFGMHPQEYRERYSGKISSRKSMAKMELASVLEIEEALKEYYKTAGGDYQLSSSVPPTIVNLDETSRGLCSDGKALTDVFENSKHLTLGKPYQMFKAIGDNVVASGENYIITSNSIKENDRKSYNILVSYGDASLLNGFVTARTVEDLKTIVNKNDGAKEFLINIKGLKGNLNFGRYKVPSSAVLANLEYVKEGGICDCDRERVLRAIKTFPKVEHESSTGGENTSIRSFLQCGEVELILVDIKDEIAG